MTEEEKQELEYIRNLKIQQINIFSDQGYINFFTYKGIKLSLNYDERSRLKDSIEAYKLLNIPTMTKIFKGNKIDFNIKEDYNKLVYMLAALEVYYSECWNITHLHLNQVKNIQDFEQLYHFNIEADYPKPLNFN